MLKELTSIGHNLTYFPTGGSAVQAILGNFLISDPINYNEDYFFFNFVCTKLLNSRNILTLKQEKSFPLTAFFVYLSTCNLKNV